MTAKCLARILSSAFEVQPHTSASDSVILFTNAGPRSQNRTVLKMSVQSIPENNSLQMEQKAYDLVRKKLQFWSPHFLVPLEIGSCKDSVIAEFAHASSPSSQKRKLYERWILLRKKIIEDYIDDAGEWAIIVRDSTKLQKHDQYDDPNLRVAQYLMHHHKTWKTQFHDVYFVLTPRMLGVSLDQFLREGALKLPVCATRDLLIQFSQALAVLNTFKMMHYDLHFGNCFVDVSEEPVTLSYHFPAKRELTTQAKVVIYDWDRAVMPGMQNTMLNNFFCENIGQCSRFVPKFDWYTVLTFFVDTGERFKSYNTDEFRRILGSLYHESRKHLRIGDDSYIGMPCECKQVKNQRCVRCTVRKLQSLISPRTYFMKHASLRVH